MTRIQTAPASHGSNLEVSHVVDAPPDDAWELLVDTHEWPEWGPSITGVSSTDRRIRPGTTGRVRTVGGLWLPFEISSCSADRMRWTWRVARIPATGHRVDALSDTRCRIVFELPTVAAGYALVCTRALERLEDLLESADSIESPA